MKLSVVPSVIAFLLFCCNVIGMEAKTISHPSSLKKSSSLQGEVISVTTMNQLCDIVIVQIQQIMKKYNMNPFGPLNQTEQLGPAKLEVNQIEVYNLTTIRRVKDQDLIVLDYPDENKITLQIQLTFDDLQIYANYVAKALGITISKGPLVAKVTDVIVAFTMLINCNNYDISLTMFKIQQMGKITFKLLGKTIEAVLIDLFSNLIVTVLRGVITQVLEVIVKKKINDVLAEISEIIQKSLAAIAQSQ